MIAKVWNQPRCPSIDEWIKKITHTQILYNHREEWKLVNIFTNGELSLDCKSEISICHCKILWQQLNKEAKWAEYAVRREGRDGSITKYGKFAYFMQSKKTKISKSYSFQTWSTYTAKGFMIFPIHKDSEKP